MSLQWLKGQVALEGVKARELREHFTSAVDVAPLPDGRCPHCGQEAIRGHNCYRCPGCRLLVHIGRCGMLHTCKKGMVD